MLHEAWLDRLTAISEDGDRVAPRGIPTLEDLDACLFIHSLQHSLLDVPARKLNFRFAVAEWIWMSCGASDVNSLAQYNSVMRNFSDDGMRLTGAYGPHINAQRRWVVDTLRNDPTSRQAIIVIWVPNPKPSKDIPCTLTLQFLIRHDRLNLIATMRSSDAWLGIPYDTFSFCQIANALAGELGVGRGWFSLRMGSSHLYERDLGGVRDVLRNQNTADTIAAPDLPGWPPYWMEDVLRRRDINAVPSNVITDPHSPWNRYVHALLAKTSDEARAWLRA